MSIEIKMDTYVENEAETRPIASERGRAKVTRYAEASVQVNYEQADAAQLAVALAALSQVCEQARLHLEDLLESARRREEAEDRWMTLQRAEAVEIAEAKDAVGKMAEREFLATEDAG